MDADAKFDGPFGRQTALRSIIEFWIAMAHRTASTTLRNYTMAPSPVGFTVDGDRRIRHPARADEGVPLSRAARSIARDGRGEMLDGLHRRTGQAPQRFCPTGDCPEARIALPNCEFCCVRGAAIGQ